MKKILFSLVMLVMTATAAWADVIPATKADVGKVLCSDGSIYATVSDAAAASKTAQAMIAYVDDENGTALGIALEDAPIADIEAGCKHNVALTVAEAFNTSHPIEGGTWRLPSANDWEHMLIGCGSTSEYVDKIPSPQWSSDPYPDGYPFNPGNIRSMMGATGGSAFHVDPYVYRGYWTSSSSSTTGGMWWVYMFEMGNSTGPNWGFDLEVLGIVRPCVEFQVPISPTYFTLTLSQTKTLVPINKTVKLTATLTPFNDYNKNVIWTTGNGNVQLFSDEECTKAVDNTPTDVLTVYVKGIAADATTVTVTSSVAPDKTASCDVTVKDIPTLKFKDGTEDVEHWTLTYFETNAVFGDMEYFGNKKIKSVTYVKSGKQASYANPRKTRWTTTLPEYDDEIEVEYYPTLADCEDNSVAIDAMNGTTVETLCLNTVVPLGWYIFSAPFDISAETAQMRCAFTEMREFVGSSYVSGGGDAAMPPTINLYFDQVTEMKAGVPYLVKTAMERDFYIYTFSDVTVNNVYTTVESKYAYFIPTNSRTLVTDDPQNVLFAESAAIPNYNPPYNATYPIPEPYHPEAPAWIKGFSGYFWLTPEVEKVFPNGGSRFTIVFGPYVPEEEPAIIGDTNGDGVVNGTDIQEIINLIVAGKYDESADINKDGKVNGTDIQEIINIIVNKEE